MSSASKKLRRSAKKAKLSKAHSKPKINKNAVFTVPISQMKQVSTDSSGGPVSFNIAVTPYTSYSLTSITQGDLYDNRATNNIRVRSLDLEFAFTNFNTAGRYVRGIVVGLRGSVNAGSTSVWDDIYRTPSTFAKLGPGGTTMDIMNNVNKDEYKVILDKTIYVPGSSDGAPVTKHIRLNKKMSNLVQYAHNSTDARSGALWLFINPCESAGVTPVATVLSMHYRLTTWFNDVRN